MSVLPPQLVPALLEAPTPIIAGHATPDADALTSMFALACGIERAGMQPTYCAVPQNTISQKLQFLVHLAKPRFATEQQCLEAGRWAICDTAKLRRVNLHSDFETAQLESKTILNIDHHASNTQYGSINFIDDTASSTAEMIYRIYDYGGWTVDETIATLLYAGIFADTVGFSLANTSADCFRIASDLVDRGANVVLVGDHLCRAQSKSEFDLRRIIYDNTQLSATRRIAFSSANYREIASAGCQASDIDDQVEIPRALSGTILAILFTEGTPGKVRVNLRSKSGLSILELAQQVGGGGHRAAAGAMLSGSIEDAMARLLPLAEEYLDRHTCIAAAVEDGE